MQFTSNACNLELLVRRFGTRKACHTDISHRKEIYSISAWVKILTTRHLLFPGLGVCVKQQVPLFVFLVAKNGNLLSIFSISTVCHLSLSNYLIRDFMMILRNVCHVFQDFHLFKIGVDCRICKLTKICKLTRVSID